MAKSTANGASLPGVTANAFLPAWVEDGIDPPTIALFNDTGTPNDFVTNDAALVISPLPDGATRKITLISLKDGSQTTGDSYTAPTEDGRYIVVVTDTLNGVEQTTTLTFELLTAAPPSPDVRLANDTGVADDRISSDGTLTVVNDDDDTRSVFYLVVPANGGQAQWTPTPPSFTDDGSYTVIVKFVDKAGNETVSSPFTFTIDTVAPNAPGVELAANIGTGGALVSVDGKLVVTLPDSDPGATIEYRIGDGLWSTTAPDGLADGDYTVFVRIKDIAGNVSEETEITFKVDAPEEPDDLDVSLETDSGTAGDKITNVADVKVEGADPDAKVQFSLDGGTTWLDALPDDLEDGLIELKVRQIDGDTVIGDVIDFSFTLDTTVAKLTLKQSATPLGISDPPQTEGNSVTVEGAETGATVEFSLDGGKTWITNLPDTLDNSVTSVMARQTDLAGNVSEVTTLELIPTGSAAPTVFTIPWFGGPTSDGPF